MIAVPLFFLALMFSAFFSGSETGFYRASRVRLALDARAGDTVARGLIWFANNSALFVATTLVGNNLANYLVSLSIVFMARSWFDGHDFSFELMASVSMAPVIFVYGELLPKYIFFHAPNRLLRAAGMPFLICAVLFSPIAALLWLCSRLIQVAVGESPERVQISLVRSELRRVLEEGHTLGLLRPGQRQLVDGMFAMANQPIGRFLESPYRLASVPLGSPLQEILRVARRFRAVEVLIVDARWREPVGYVKSVDLQIGTAERGFVEARPLLVIGQRESPVAALNRLRSERVSLGRVVDDYGKTLGVVTVRGLVQHLLANR